MSTRYEVHHKKFYGRPRSQVTALLDHAVRGRARNARKIDRYQEHADRIHASLGARDSQTLGLYEMAVEDDHALAGFIMALKWMLGDGLGQVTFNGVMSAEWGEEIVNPYDVGTQP